MTFRWKTLVFYIVVVTVSVGLYHWWTVRWLEQFYVEEMSAGLRRFLLWKTVMLLVVGALVTLLISGRLTRAIRHLTEASRRIAAGDFVDSIPVSSRDELGDLARNMEQMSRRLQGQVQTLESERQHLDTVLSSMSEGVLVVDRRGRVTKVNPAFNEIFDVKVDPVGRMPLEVVRNEEIQQGIHRMLTRRSEREEEEIRVSRMVLQAHFAPVRKAGSDVEGVVIVFHDITRLRRLEQLRKEFVSNVSHELKTPLTSIRGYAETLTEDLEGDGLHRRFAERILHNSEQLTQMIEDLLNLAQLEGKERLLKQESIHFENLMKELEKEFSARLSAKGIRFVWESRLDTDTLRAEPAYLWRVFHNLIDNALKYTDHGEIRVELDDRQGRLLFSVADSGIGIPQEDLGRIFERFYRVDKDRSRRTGGSGIGLAIVKHIVQLHGGQAWAESRLGAGTRICFTLPR